MSSFLKAKRRAERIQLRDARKQGAIMRYDVTQFGNQKRQRLTFGDFASIITTMEATKIRALPIGGEYVRPTNVADTVPLTVRRVE
jgi:hypothetical protein